MAHAQSMSYFLILHKVCTQSVFAKKHFTQSWRIYPLRHRYAMPPPPNELRCPRAAGEAGQLGQRFPPRIRGGLGWGLKEKTAMLY